MAQLTRQRLGRPERRALPAAAIIVLDQLKSDRGWWASRPGIFAYPERQAGREVELWRAYAYQAGISSGDSDGARRKAFGRAVEKLVAERLVGTAGPSGYGSHETPGHSSVPGHQQHGAGHGTSS